MKSLRHGFAGDNVERHRVLWHRRQRGETESSPSVWQRPAFV